MTVEFSRWSKGPYVFIDGDMPAHVESALDDELSYEVEGYEYADAWKTGDWDGRKHLYNRSRGGNAYFPLGLLDRVREIMDSFGVEYDVSNVICPGRGDLDPEWDTDMMLRDYQADAVTECLRRGRGVIAMPTGSGKTLIGLRLAYELKRQTLVLAHRQEIADQWVAKLRDILGVDPAKCYGGVREDGDHQVALYQSVYDDGDVRDDVRLDHDLLLADECHRVGADTFSAVALDVNAEYRFGMSATPEREDNATLEVTAGTGTLVSDISPEGLIEDGHLAEPEWRLLDAPRASGMYRRWQQEYKGEIVTNEGRNEMIADEVTDLPKPCYVAVERIEHGDRLEALMDGAAFISSDSTDRAETIEAFRDGDQPVLVSTLLGEGFDLPELQSIVMAGGMKTEIGAIQKVGRALRPGTDGAVVVDCIDKGRWVGDHSEERVRTYKDYYGKFGP